MWIIPKNLDVYHSALDTVESKEELSLQGLELEQSLMWRSKPFQLRTWLQRWSRVKWFRLLCGRILKPSQWKSFEVAWTSSLVDSPANHSQVQGNDAQTKTKDTYFHFLKELLEKSNQNTYSSKMLTESLQLDFLELDGQTNQEHQFCSMSLESWNEWVTEQRLANIQRVQLVRHMEERGGLSMESWGTPRACSAMAANLNCSGNLKSKNQNLETQIGNLEKKNWATPNTMDHMEQRSPEALKRQSETTRKGRSMPANLREQVNPEALEIYSDGQQDQDENSLFGKSLEQFPTPRTADAEGGRITPTERTPQGFKSKRAKSNQWFGAKLRDAIEMEQPKNIRLNPNWVEQLMGLQVGLTQLPIGWIDSECAETE